MLNTKKAQNPENLLIKQALQIGIVETQTTVFEKGGYVILDFAREQTPLPGRMNNFPMYSMWWVIILADYYSATHTTDFISRQLNYLQGLIAQMNQCVGDDGELNYPSYFVDWPTVGSPTRNRAQGR